MSIAAPGEVTAMLGTAAGLICAALTAWCLYLHTRLKRMRATLDGMDQGALLLDRQDRVLNWNRALLRLRGIPPERLARGMSFRAFLAAAAAYRDGRHGSALPAEPWHGVLDPGEQHEQDVELSNGNRLLVRAARARDGQVLVTYADVGSIKQSQLAYRDLATRLVATLDNVLDAIITINDRGTVDSFSAGAEQMFGYSAHEVVGQNVNVLMTTEHRERHDGYLDAYRRTGVSHILGSRRQVEARRKNGEVFPIELGVSEIRVGGQRLFIGIVRDISERLRVERMQQEFVATVSHELRTPLTSIIGAMGLLQAVPEASGNPRAQRLLEIAARNGRRLQQLIDDILDAARSNVESLELSLEPQSLAEILRLSVEANQAYAASFDVRLELFGVEADITARVDSGRLQQVLGNLISNAIKFSPRNECVAVRLARDSRFALLEVCDRGPGIADSFRARMFTKFAQADSSDSRAKGGTGLGLYIARNLVERMGGQIEVESEIDRGSTFRVRLPLHLQRSAAATATPEGPASEVYCARQAAANTVR
jgi:PAS domain S-box-containing protein